MNEKTPTPEIPNCTRIISLHSENVMKLRAIDMTPPEHLVIVAGDNEQGKSSLLSSIEMALKGADAFPAMPVRRGQSKALTEIDLGGLTVRRVITAEGNTTLVVKPKDGAALSSPQKVLDELTGKRSFDPMAFMKLRPEHRADMLRQIAGLDFTKLEADKKKLYDERTDLNRDAVKLKGSIALMPKPDASIPKEPVSTSEILAEQQVASKRNADNALARQECVSINRDFKSAVDATVDASEAISNLKQQIENLKNVLKVKESNLSVLIRAKDEAKRKAEEASAKVADLKDEVLAGFSTRLQEAEATNAAIRADEDRVKALKELAEIESKSTKLTRQIDALDTKKADMIQGAKFPIDGLGFTDSGAVAVGGIPFEQCSTSKQLRVSVAMGVALNPRLRVLLIRNGNDLDEKNLKLMGEMAREHNCQIWIERCSQQGDVAVIIEDGCVKESAPKQQEQELGITP